MIQQKLQDFEEEIKPIGEIMTQATIDMYRAVVARFLPTPTKIHYLFNLRDISRVSEIGIDEIDVDILKGIVLIKCTHSFYFFSTFVTAVYF